MPGREEFCADDRRAFVRGVLEKMMDEQDELEWTQTALASNARYSRWLFAGLLIASVLALSLMSMLARHFFLGGMVFVP